MSYGLEATNSSGQVLISSEFKNLHFKEKKTSPTYTDINSNGLFGGVKLMRYRFSLSETPVPFFHVPSGNSCAITAVRSVSSGVWDIEVLTDGVNPEIYIFATSAVTSSSDSFIKDSINGTWSENYKWKPPEENTIDFKIKFVKE